MAELYHHGVLGQKWGVRRYQNEDGTLTEAGKKRYGNLPDKMVSKAIKKDAKKDSKELYRSLHRTYVGSLLVNMAAVSKMDKENYDTYIYLMNSGQLSARATFKKNPDLGVVDLYMGKEKNPTLRIRLDEGEQIAYDFMDENGAQNYEDFMKYYNEKK